MDQQFLLVGLMSLLRSDIAVDTSDSAASMNSPYVTITAFFSKWVVKSNTAGLAMDCRVGLRWHFCSGFPISNPRSVLDFLSKNQGSFFYFFEKLNNELVQPKIVLLAILAKFDGSPVIAIR